MTYGELNQIKTTGFATNHVIDDAVSNARWASKAWKSEPVSQYDLNKIAEWATREGVSFPLPGSSCAICGSALEAHGSISTACPNGKALFSSIRILEESTRKEGRAK